ncbi:MAG: tetratricopeptide repeat protein [Bacteroidota bacterium]
MHKAFVWTLLLCFFATVSGQEGKDNESDDSKRAFKESTNITYEANEELVQNDFVQAEADYRRAISKSGDNTAAPYNLGRAYYNRESFAEAFARFKEAGEKAGEKPTKHKAFHNMGNVFMQNKEYEKAVEAYKQALRSNPYDDETRYNLALAKEMLKNDQNNQNNDQNKDDKNNDQNKDNKEQNQDQNKEGDQNKDNEGDQKDDQNKDQGDEGDQGDQKPEENKKGDGEEKQEQKKQPNQGEEPEKKPRPRPNQLSKQQIQNLLEAMQNEEKKVQEKIDAKKVKGKKIKNEKDW